MNNSIQELTAPRRWDSTQTREMTGRLHGSKQFTLIGPVVRSVAVRLAHVQIHYSDYLGLFKKHFTDHLGDEYSAEELLFGEDGSDDIGANNSFFIRAEAHVYASLQALHALADNMSHVVYYALGWNLDQRLSLRDVSFHRILSQLNVGTQNGEPLDRLVSAFETLKSDPEFLALENAANHLKHHGGLPVSLRLTGENMEALEASLMEYKRLGVPQPSQPVLSRIERSHAAVAMFVFNAGTALNEALRLRLL
ncbi:MAG: hypothetical protein IH617_00740 [Hydrogenophaga sp.]|nr:hypothetical protein [Hydrogenophaga sp.]